MLAGAHPTTSGTASSEMPSDDRAAAAAAGDASAAAAQREEKEGKEGEAAVAAVTQLVEKRLSSLKEEHVASVEDARAREVELEESLQVAQKARKRGEAGIRIIVGEVLFQGGVLLFYEGTPYNTLWKTEGVA